MAAMAGKSGLIKWQAPMVKVLYALAPIALSSVYFYGWRVVTLLAAVTAAGFASEYAFTRRWRQPVSSAIFVTTTLYWMSLPPTLPHWMAVVGIVFAVIFGKMVFGGFGKNIFNPALSGRAFIYVCFGGPMTAQWCEPVGGRFGGWAAWTSDAVTQATPGMLMKAGRTFALPELFFGSTAGTIGGSAALLVFLGGLYIVWTRAASYRIVGSGLAGYLGTQGALWALGVKGAAHPVHALLAGSVLIGLFFYATDPVSASQTNEGRWIYGAFVGSMSSLISVFSVWAAGTMFAILLGNMFAPILDYGISALKERGAAGVGGAAGSPAASGPGGGVL